MRDLWYCQLIVYGQGGGASLSHTGKTGTQSTNSNNNNNDNNTKNSNNNNNNNDNVNNSDSNFDTNQFLLVDPDALVARVREQVQNFQGVARDQLIQSLVEMLKELRSTDRK